jgi:UDPglucose 6-dehydrogenase
VTFIDVLPSQIEALFELGHDARSTLDLTAEPDSYIFVTLPTPNEGYRYDLTAFRAGIRSVGHALAGVRGKHTVVIRSTVPPRPATGPWHRFWSRSPESVRGLGFSSTAIPEFLRAASAAEDFMWPWMTVVASRNRGTAERLGDLPARFGGSCESSPTRPRRN